MTRRGWQAAGLVLVLLTGACQATTTRPPFSPVAGAPFADIDLSVARATGIVAQAFQDDSLPLSHVEARDGIVETPWFDATTLAPTKARPLGPNIVQVRAWIDPTKPGSSRVTVETIYRPTADPSVPERELDRPVPKGHPVGKRVGELVTDLLKTYGTPPPVDSTAVATPAYPADSVRDST
jgi:hypothetical protein